MQTCQANGSAGGGRERAETQPGLRALAPGVGRLVAAPTHLSWAGVRAVLVLQALTGEVFPGLLGFVLLGSSSTGSLGAMVFVPGELRCRGDLNRCR